MVRMMVVAVIGPRCVIHRRGIVVRWIVGVGRWPIVAIWIVVGAIAVMDDPSGHSTKGNACDDFPGVACFS